MSRFIPILLIAASAALIGAPASADADPTMHQVYQAAESGHLDQAQNMIAQVLKDHPNSAKAHYVAAELDSRQGKLAGARDEFQTAERLEPGLPFARADSVAELRAQLFQQQRAAPQYVQPVPHYVQGPVAVSGGHFPWGLVISIGLIVAIVGALLRRRQVIMPSYGPNYGGGAGAGPVYGGGGPGPYYGGGYAPPGGSGLLGSLGTGLAVGAGVVAGEELAHHFLDGNGNRIVEAAPQQEVIYRDEPGNQNADMGGQDFGVNDSGSWDDNSGGGGGGGGDDSWS